MGQTIRKYKILKKKESHVVTHRVIRVGPGRVSAFSRTNQGHGLGKVRLRETESSSAFTANSNLFLTIQHGDCCIQNGVRRVPRYVVDVSVVAVHTTARRSLHLHKLWLSVSLP